MMDAADDINRYLFRVHSLMYKYWHTCYCPWQYSKNYVWVMCVCTLIG